MICFACSVFSGLITSVSEERYVFSAIDYA